MTHFIRQFQTMLSMINDNHLDGIKHIRALNVGVNDLKYAVTAAACAYVRMLAMDERKRAEFYAEPFWHFQKRFHRSKDLLHVLMFINNVKDGGNYKLASAHSVALQTLCNDTDISDEDLAQHIKDCGGFSGLVAGDEANEGVEEAAEVFGDAEQETPAPRRVRASPILTGDDDQSDGDAEDEQESDFSDETDEERRRPVRKPTKAAVLLRRLPRGYVDRCILGRPASGGDREAVLSPLRDGKSVWVKLVPQQTAERYELFKGSGDFIDLLIEDFEVE